MRRAAGQLGFALLAVGALVVVVALLSIWYDIETSGPANDSSLAERSLAAAFADAHHGVRPVRVHCDGLRDGSNSFGCTVYRGADALIGYDLLYDDDSKTYRADSASPQTYTNLRFEPKR